MVPAVAVAPAYESSEADSPQAVLFHFKKIISTTLLYNEPFSYLPIAVVGDEGCAPRVW